MKPISNLFLKTILPRKINKLNYEKQTSRWIYGKKGADHLWTYFPPKQWLSQLANWAALKKTPNSL